MILTKEKLTYISENLKVNKDDVVFIHHPITEDIIKVIVKDKTNTSLTVSIPEDSDYFGQPDFKIKKYTVLSL